MPQYNLINMNIYNLNFEEGMNIFEGIQTFATSDKTLRF